MGCLVYLTMDKPIYLQIEEELLKEIKKTKPNTPILSEREIAEKYNTSRMTVRKAIRHLVDEGYLYREGNIGTFVADQKLRKKNGYITILSNENLQFKILHFNYKSAVNEICEKLEIQLSDKYVVIIRLNLNQNKVISIDEFYINRKFIKSKSLENINEMLDLSNHDEIGAINQIYHSEIVPYQYANIFKIDLKSPIISIESYVHSKNGNTIAYVKSYLHPNHTQLEITL